MVEIKTLWSEDNLKEYYRFMIFSQRKLPKILLVVLPILCLLMVIMCLIVFIQMQIPTMLVLAILIAVGFAVSAVIILFMIKSVIKETLKTNENSEFDKAVISKDAIILYKDEKPLGALEWEKIEKIFVNEKGSAVYLSAGENEMLILESKNIINGTWEALKEIAKEKHDKLPEKA